MYSWINTISDVDGGLKISSGILFDFHDVTLFLLASVLKCRRTGILNKFVSHYLQNKFYHGNTLNQLLLILLYCSLFNSDFVAIVLSESGLYRNPEISCLST